MKNIFPRLLLGHFRRNGGKSAQFPQERRPLLRKGMMTMNKKLPRNRHDDGTKFTPSPKKKKSLFDAFKEPVVQLVLEPQLQITGNSELYIEGCKAILEYDDMMVKLVVGKKELLITGKDLSVSGYTESSITVKGAFQTLEWN